MTIRNFVPAAAAFLVLGVAGWMTPDASAQTMWDQVKVHLPYSVTVGNKTMPPGDYKIQQLESPSGDSPVLLIYTDNGMKFETSAMTIHTLDPNTPEKTDVTLHHIGDNYYLDKIWIAGKNYGYEIPLPKSVRERATEAAAVSVPATNTQTDTAATESSTSTTETTTQPAVAPPPPPPPPPTPAEQPEASATPTPTPQQPVETAENEGSANREKQPEPPAMPKTSAGWLLMLLSGGTLSGAGMMLRRKR